MIAFLYSTPTRGTVSRIHPAAPAVEPPFELLACAGLSSGRERVEQYIAGVFQAAWDARVLGFLPLLCSLERDNTVLAALGLRSARHGPLFCEQYLQGSVTDAVDALNGGRSHRGDILELGNLAASQPGQGALLYLLVTAAIHEAGICYLIFAANRAVRVSICRSGFTPQAICPARPEKLGSAAGDWGRYYDGDPEVMIGDMALTHRQALSRPVMAAELTRYADTVSALAVVIRALAA